MIDDNLPIPVSVTRADVLTAMLGFGAILASGSVALVNAIRAFDSPLSTSFAHKLSREAEEMEFVPMSAEEILAKLTPQVLDASNCDPDYLKEALKTVRVDGMVIKVPKDCGEAALEFAEGSAYVIGSDHGWRNALITDEVQREGEMSYLPRIPEFMSGLSLLSMGLTAALFKRLSQGNLHYARGLAVAGGGMQLLSYYLGMEFMNLASLVEPVYITSNNAALITRLQANVVCAQNIFAIAQNATLPVPNDQASLPNLGVLELAAMLSLIVFNSTVCYNRKEVGGAVSAVRQALTSRLWRCPSSASVSDRAEVVPLNASVAGYQSFEIEVQPREVQTRATR